MTRLFLLACATLLGIAACASAPVPPRELARAIDGRKLSINTADHGSLLGWKQIDEIFERFERGCRAAGGRSARSEEWFRFDGRFKVERSLPSRLTCSMPDPSASWVVDGSYDGSTRITEVFNPGTRMLDVQVHVRFGDARVVAARLAAEERKRLAAEAFERARAEEAAKRDAERRAAEEARRASIPIFQAALKRGDRFQMQLGYLTVTGLVVEVKPPLAFVQFDNVQDPRMLWVPIERLEPVSADLNR